MGINASSAEFLLQAQAAGVSFREIVTLGRQNLAVSDIRLKHLITEYGIPDFRDAQSAKTSYEHDLPHPAETFFQALGAEKVDSVDADAYQSATIIQDMNLPIPKELHQQYDCVIDGGTLEHIFAFPTAIRSCMEMVKVGGHLIVMTPANNFFGHGFYQFSPELFFRILSPENGFCVERMVAIESEGLSYEAQGKVCYYEKSSRPRDVLDPASTGKRGLLQNNKSVLLYIQAKRQADVPIFAKTPQQSDYVTQWQENSQSSGSQSASGLESSLSKVKDASRRWLKKVAPPQLKLHYHQRAASFGNRNTFR